MLKRAFVWPVNGPNPTCTVDPLKLGSSRAGWAEHFFFSQTKLRMWFCMHPQTLSWPFDVFRDSYTFFVRPFYNKVPRSNFPILLDHRPLPLSLPTHPLLVLPPPAPSSVPPSSILLHHHRSIGAGGSDLNRVFLIGTVGEAHPTRGGWCGKGWSAADVRAQEGEREERRIVLQKSWWEESARISRHKGRATTVHAGACTYGVDFSPN